MSEPRGSTDEETAPLLDRQRAAREGSFFSALTHPTRQLTNLEKLLAVAGIVLLVLTSTFVGLFAGAEVALKKEQSKGTKTEWRTETRTQTATKTAPGSTITVIPTGKPESDICVTKECVQLAASILESLNSTVDPCDDFYEFANGGWLASNEIPADKGRYGSFDVVANRNKKIILKVLDSIPSATHSDEEILADADEANKQKLKAVYTSCLDVDRLNHLGAKPLLPMVEHLVDVFGPFDLNPAPEGDFQITAEEAGRYDEDYVLPESLASRAETVADLKANKKLGRSISASSSSAKRFYDQLDESISLESRVKGKDSDRVARITQALAYLHSRGVDALVNFAIEGDAGGEDSQVQSLWLYQAFGGLPSKEYYEEKPILDLYQSVIAGVLTHIAESSSLGDKENAGAKRGFIDEIEELEEMIDEQGWPWPWPGDDKGGDDPKEPATPPKKDEPLSKRMERLAAKVVTFERELMRAGTDPEYLFNPHYAYNPFPAEKVDKAIAFLDLPLYISTFAPRVYPINITVTYPPYLKSVSRIVQDTPDYVLSGYFITRLAMSYGSALGPKVGVKQELQRLVEVLRGIKKGTEENRMDVCLGYVDDIVGFIAGREFVREAFSPEAKAEGEHIINSIVSAFHDKVPHISWMDKESATAAQKKAEAIIPKVGYPLTPNTTDPGSLQFWYGRMQIKADDFFGNVLRSTLVEESRVWMGLGRKRDRQTWEMYPQTVNAYYSPPDGEIVFPAGILQPPFYSQDWPSHLKYGAFGAVAAHELTHAFDNSGSQYDEKGRLRQWWTNSTTDAFEERAQCIAKQYSTYYVLDPDGKKVHVNGNLTNGEGQLMMIDIADSGLAQAYLAWKDSLKSSSLGKDKPLRLPGLDFTKEQLFFIAFAHAWEQLTRPATAVVRIRTDPHSPPYWRATGTLRNLKAFHDAFECKAGSRMNPKKEDQCGLW